MNPSEFADLQSSYDLLAEEYARRIYDELQHKPLDRELLDRFAAEMRGKGCVCELGCGPGHVARYLHERSVSVIGIDLSPKMVELGRKLNPEIHFEEGNMLRLGAGDASWAGIVAFYSIIHIPGHEIPNALREMRRVLIPNGLLFLAFHLGKDPLRVEELWDKKVSMDFFFFEREEILRRLSDAGFSIEYSMERDPYPEVEVQTRRAYVLARKGSGERTEAG